MMLTKSMQHQQAAFNKLSRLKVGALFMEMGTGKTRTFLELGLQKIDAVKASRIVIICPVSGMEHLSNECLKHTGNTAIIHRGGYNQSAGLVNIIGTESMSSSIRAINKLKELSDGAVIIQDESHQIKNKDALRTRRIIDSTRYSAYRYLSTGTPITNGVEDLWSQCDFLSYLVLGYHSYGEFQRMHLTHEGDWYGNYGQGRIIGRFNTELIAKKLGVYSFEARKKDCLELPPKSYAYYTAQMSGELSDVYNSAKKAILGGKNAFEVDDATVFRLFTTLQQISLGIVPQWLMDELVLDGHYENPKIKVLMETLESMPKQSKKVIWCKYIAEADDVTRFLKYAGYAVVNIDGRVNPNLRGGVLVELAQDAEILVATTATGGQVWDMGFVDYAIYMSNSFDYQVRAQSEDRIHRKGMSDKAHYVDIFTECGIEKRIQRSIGSKENAAKAFMDNIRQLRSLPTKQAVEALQQEFEKL